MTPVWRVFASPLVNQLVYMLTLALAIGLGFWLFGWWGVVVGIGAVFGSWQMLIFVLWRRRGRPREPNRFGPDSRWMRSFDWVLKLDEPLGRAIYFFLYYLVQPVVWCGIAVAALQSAGMSRGWSAGCGIPIGAALTVSIFWARRKGWVTFDGDGTGIGP